MKRIAAFIISLVCVMNVFPQEKLTIEYENGDSYYGNVYVNIKQTRLDISEQRIRSINKSTIKEHGQGTFISVGGVEYEVAWSQVIEEETHTNVSKLKIRKISQYSIERHGHGTYTFKDGSKYEGTWEHNLRHGKGTYTSSQAGYVYKGDYYHDKEQGQGEKMYKDGTHYIGEFANGTYNGKGEVTWGDGWHYIGSFVDGKMNGHGVLKQNDEYYYEGNFVDNKKAGKGKEESECGVYSGEFYNDRYEGLGEIHYQNGESYIGSYKNGLRNGKGKYSWPNGSVFEGLWKDDKRNGAGHYIYPNGQKVTGVWRDDKSTEHTNICTPYSLIAFFSGFSNVREEGGGSYQGDVLLCGYNIMDHIEEGWAIQFSFNQGQLAQIRKSLGVTDKKIRCKISLWKDEQMTEPFKTIKWDGKTKIMDGIFNYNEDIKSDLKPIYASWNESKFIFDIANLNSFSIFLPDRLWRHMKNVTAHDISSKTIFFLKYEYSVDGGKTYQMLGDWFRPHQAKFQLDPINDTRDAKNRFKTLEQKGAEDFF